jgi:hypothetical protein
MNALDLVVSTLFFKEEEEEEEEGEEEVEEEEEEDLTDDGHCQFLLILLPVHFLTRAYSME